MLKTVRGILVSAVIAALIGLPGWWVVDRHTVSGADLQRESERLVQEYEPTCDGERMRPGDTCLAFGRGAGNRAGTYEHLVEQHRSSVAPDKLADSHRNWRYFGRGLQALAAVVLLVGVLVTLATAVKALRQRTVMRRTAQGRRMLAAEHGWTYIDEDRTLAKKSPSLPWVVDPAATGIVEGTREGTPFRIYTHIVSLVHTGPMAAFRVQLPVPVPRFHAYPRSSHPIGGDVDPAVQGWLEGAFSSVLADRSLPSFVVDGTELFVEAEMSAEPASMLAALDRVLEVRRQLIAGLQQAPPPPPSENTPIRVVDRET